MPTTLVQVLALADMEHALDVSTSDNVITHHLVDPYVTFDTLHSYTCTHRRTDTHSEDHISYTQRTELIVHTQTTLYLEKIEQKKEVTFLMQHFIRTSHRLIACTYRIHAIPSTHNSAWINVAQL